MRALLYFSFYDGRDFSIYIFLLVLLIPTTFCFGLNTASYRRVNYFHTANEKAQHSSLEISSALFIFQMDRWIAKTYSPLSRPTGRPADEYLIRGVKFLTILYLCTNTTQAIVGRAHI